MEAFAYYGMMNGWNGYSSDGYYSPFSWALSTVTVVVIVFGILLAIRLIGKGKYERLHGEAALDILKRRYASGEIDKKEYEEKKKDLS
jgi:putative membrane protein